MRRRELLVAGAAALLVRPAVASAATDEGALLARLWEREKNAAFAYEWAIQPDLARHEGEHAAALETELAALALPPPRAPGSVDKLDISAQNLATQRTRAAAIAMEQSLIEAYQAAVPVLPDPKTAMTAATILASHAQHLLILREHAGLAASWPAG